MSRVYRNGWHSCVDACSRACSSCPERAQIGLLATRRVASHSGHTAHDYGSNPWRSIRGAEGQKQYVSRLHCALDTRLPRCSVSCRTQVRTQCLTRGSVRDLHDARTTGVCSVAPSANDAADPRATSSSKVLSQAFNLIVRGSIPRWPFAPRRGRVLGNWSDRKPQPDGFVVGLPQRSVTVAPRRDTVFRRPDPSSRRHTEALCVSRYYATAMQDADQARKRSALLRRWAISSVTGVRLPGGILRSRNACYGCTPHSRRTAGAARANSPYPETL